MTVNPGYGGQAFIPEVLPKMRAVAERTTARKTPLRISVDGGIDLTTASQVAGQGADVLIAGSSLYKANDMGAAIREMREAAAKAFVRPPGAAPR